MNFLLDSLTLIFQQRNNSKTMNTQPELQPCTKYPQHQTDYTDGIGSHPTHVPDAMRPLKPMNTFGNALILVKYFKLYSRKPKPLHLHTSPTRNYSPRNSKIPTTMNSIIRIIGMNNSYFLNEHASRGIFTKGLNIRNTIVYDNSQYNDNHSTTLFFCNLAKIISENLKQS